MNGTDSKKSFILTFAVLYLFWIILSNIFDWVHLSLGIVSCLIVAYISHDLLITRKNFKKIPIEIYKFVKYFFWLIKEIVKANIDVAKIVLDPELPMSPRIIKYDSELEKDISKATLGNSITLTPGTLTIDIDEESSYYIHCLAKHHATGFKESGMENNVQEVFESEEGYND